MAFSPKEAGQRIRERRTQLNISLPKAALDLHLSPDYLRKIERGTRNMPPDLIVSLSEYLSVTIDYLFTGEQAHPEFDKEIGQVISILESIRKKI